MAVASEEIRNVAVVGGTGLIGSSITKELVLSGLFSVTVLSRSQRGDLGHGVNLAIADYNDEESLVKALKGQDAIICALSREAILLQLPLINAAVIAGVKRFIPSEFGSNLQDAQIRKFPNYRQKVQVEDYLEQKSKSHGLTYTFIYNNVLLDWAIKTGAVIDLKGRKAGLFNGGQRPVSMITTRSVARAVAGVLRHTEETRNRPVYIHEVLMSQKELLDYAKDVFPKDEWHEEYVDLGKAEEHFAALETAAGPKLKMFHQYAVMGAFDEGFGNQYGETDNQMLGVTPLTAKDVKKILMDIFAEKYD